MARKAPHRKTIDGPDGRRIVDKRANGEGEPYWDESKQRWRGPYIDPTTLKRRTVLALTKTEAAEKAAAKRALLETTAPTGILGANPTMTQLCEWFMDHVADVQPGTYATYSKHCQRITERLGTVRILDLKVEHVRLFMTDLRESGRSSNYVANVRARLRQVVEEAITLGYVEHNVVSKVPAPARKRERGKPRFTLTADQVKALVEKLMAHELGAAIAIMFLLGNRAGEALGLAWTDVDLEATEYDPDVDENLPAPYAVIRRASGYVPPIKGKPERRSGQLLGPTKTAGAEGRLRLPPSVAALLVMRRVEQNADREQAGLAWATNTYEGEALDMVFTDSRGRLIRSNTFLQAVKDCVEAAGISTAGVSTRTGRRSVITALYDAGLDLSDVQRLIGHTDPATTAGYVQHLNRRPQSTVQFARELLDPASAN